MATPISSKILPPIQPETDRSGETGGLPPFDWGTLVAQTVHPAKVAIIEALRWVGRPRSATELAAMLEDKSYPFSKIYYHAGGLVELGSIEVAYSRETRGAREFFYAITDVEPDAC